MDISRKIMEILDDNAQQVPEGFYLEMCNQLKKLHVARPPRRADLERRELEVRRAKDRLNQHATELNRLKEQVNKSIRDYNKYVKNFKEKKRKLEDRLQVREDCLKSREEIMDDFLDNMTLAEFKRTLGL
jgi:septal ring factor EnvC (AmiA/AmiB activator)